MSQNITLLSPSKVLFQRYKLDNGSGVVRSFERRGTIAAAARRLFEISLGVDTRKNVLIELVAPSTEALNPHTGLTRFDKLASSGDAVMHGNAFTNTQSGSMMGSPEMSTWDKQTFDSLCIEMERTNYQRWLDRLQAPKDQTHLVVTKVAHKVREEDILRTTHGWILSTADGKHIESVCSLKHERSLAIMQFYAKALCYGDWERKELILEIENGQVVFALPEVQARADSIKNDSPYPASFFQNNVEDEILVPSPSP